jgi:hypothetical protein
MARFEYLIVAMGRLEAITQANQEKMETNREELLTEMETNQERLKPR